MNPKTVQKLRQLPEFKELLGYLSEELAKLHTLEGLPDDRIERELAVAGKLWAHKTLSAVLAPLLSPVDNLTGTDMQEYVV